MLDITLCYHTKKRLRGIGRSHEQVKLTHTHIHSPAADPLWFSSRNILGGRALHIANTLTLPFYLLPFYLLVDGAAWRVLPQL